MRRTRRKWPGRQKKLAQTGEKTRHEEALRQDSEDNQPPNQSKMSAGHADGTDRPSIPAGQEDGVTRRRDETIEMGQPPAGPKRTGLLIPQNRVPIRYRAHRGLRIIRIGHELVGETVFR